MGIIYEMKQGNVSSALSFKSTVRILPSSANLVGYTDPNHVVVRGKIMAYYIGKGYVESDTEAYAEVTVDQVCYKK